MDAAMPQATAGPYAANGDAFAIDVHDMTKRFGARTAVDHVSLKVRAGEICGFLGPNGSGKTTFIRMLCGLLRADEGRGTCLGYDVIEESEEIKLHVGYMTQRFSFYEDLSIEENLDFVARMYAIPNRRQAVRESLARLGLTGRKDQVAGELSGGWKQRLALAACLIHRPRLMLLDEPTAGVDPKARREFWEEIHRLAAEGMTFLIATHYMDEAERCHRLAFISYGKLLTQGTVEEVIAEARLTTWSVDGPELYRLAEQMRGRPGVEQAVAFGNELHVSGADERALEEAIAPFRGEPYRWRRVEAGLEDVFIHLMNQSQDNFS
jgi:ABC-2 type transport system ATP-binding protein